MTIESLVIDDNTLRAVLIDPFKQQIEDLRVDKGNEAIYKAIDARPMDRADFFPRTVKRDGKEAKIQHSVYVDDEGLFKPKQRFWFNRFTGQVLAGKGLIFAIDDDGDNTNCLWTKEGVLARITWLGDRQSLAVLGQMGVLDRLPRKPTEFV